MNDENAPLWVEAIRQGNWDAAEADLRNKIISQAGPQYQQMKTLEDLQAINRSHGNAATSEVVQVAFDRTVQDERRHKLTPAQAVSRYSEVLDEEVLHSYFDKRRAQEDRNHGRDNVG